jgi:hypothetical protein
MASTSKYIQLNPQILLEYIYQDPALPTVIDTDTNGARVMILDNTYTGTNFMFTEDNPYVPTGNYRTISAIPINSKRTKYAYLTTNMPLNYLDYDTNLPDVASLLAQLTTPPNVPPEAVQYDTLRLHLISGYSFASQGDGFIFDVQFTDGQGKRQNLTSIAFLNTDNYEVINPDEFIIGERLYTKYIDLKIPAISYLNNVTISNPLVTTSLSYLMTNGSGVRDSTMIDFSLKDIITTEVVNGYKYFLTGNEVSVSINKTDEYSGLSAAVQESPNGDFFELYGEYNGDIYEDFIISLDNLPNTKIIVFHDVRVIEQVGTSFITTSENSFLQSNDFGVPYKFRPIVLNSAVATSYRIEYTLRIFNTVDNSQIVRQSQYASFDVKKYGRRIRKINLGVEPVVAKVYNTIPDNKPVVNLTSYNRMNITQDGGVTTIQTEFVTSFVDRNRISASVSAVKVTPAVKQQGDVLPTAKGQSMLPANIPLSIEQIANTDKVYQQGEGPIGISPFDNFYQFIIYNNAVSDALGVGEPQLVDLTNTGSLYLNFFDQKTGLKIKLKNYTNIKQLNPANGEVVFKIPSEESSKILGLTDTTYYISTVLETGGGTSEETLLYTGTWYNSKSKADKVASDTITDLQKVYSALEQSTTAMMAAKDANIEVLKAERNYQQEYIISLQNKISDLGGDLSDLANSLSSAADTIAAQQAAYEQAIANVNSTQSTSTTSATTQTETPSTPIVGTETSSAPPKNNNFSVSEEVLGKNSGISTRNIRFNK